MSALINQSCDIGMFTDIELVDASGLVVEYRTGNFQVACLFGSR